MYYKGIKLISTPNIISFCLSFFPIIDTRIIRVFINRRITLAMIPHDSRPANTLQLPAYFQNKPGLAVSSGKTQSTNLEANHGGSNVMSAGRVNEMR